MAFFMHPNVSPPCQQTLHGKTPHGSCLYMMRCASARMLPGLYGDWLRLRGRGLDGWGTVAILPCQHREREALSWLSLSSRTSSALCSWAEPQRLLLTTAHSSWSVWSSSSF